MQVSDQGIDMLVAFEGMELQAYRCPSGVWTIGAGHTGTVDGRPIAKGMTISHDKAMELLRKDLERFEECINGQPFAKRLMQNQFDALVSFVFNVGTAAFHSSTMRRKLCSGADSSSVAEEFGRWIYGKKGVLPGLVRRRKIEAAMFLHGGGKEAEA